MTTAAIEKAKPKEYTRALVVDLLEKYKTQLAAAMPKHVTADRLTKLMVFCMDANPDLYKCTQVSLFAAIKQLAELGLEPGGVRGLAYLIPYKKGGADLGRLCQLIIGYKGYISLAKRSGMVKDIEARVVHTADKFQVEFGLEPRLSHRPYLGNGSPGAPIAVYCIARGADGVQHVELMTWEEIQRIKNRALGSKSDSPWLTDEEEMARKTVVRRWAKYAELSPEMADAVRIDSENEDAIEGEMVAPMAAMQAGKAKRLPESGFDHEPDLASEGVAQPVEAKTEEASVEKPKDAPKTEEAPKRVERKESEMKPVEEKEAKEEKKEASAKPVSESPGKFGSVEHAKWLIEQIKAAPDEATKKTFAGQIDLVHPDFSAAARSAYLTKKF